MDRWRDGHTHFFLYRIVLFVIIVICCFKKFLSSFREVTTKVAKKYFNESWNAKRVEFIPVDWRTGLTLDNGICVCCDRVIKVLPSNIIILLAVSCNTSFFQVNQRRI